MKKRMIRAQTESTQTSDANRRIYKNGSSLAIDYEISVKHAEERATFKKEADKAFEAARRSYLESRKTSDSNS